MTTEPTILWPRSLSAALADRGVDLQRLTEAQGLSPGALHDPDLRLPLRGYGDLLWAVVEATDDPAIGLLLGTELRPEMFGIVGQMAMFSPTLGAALEMLARYKQLVSPDRLLLDADADADAVWIAFVGNHDDDQRLRVHADAELAFVLSLGRRMTGVPIDALALQLRGAPVDYAPAYARLFGCAPTFGATRDAVLLETSALALPLRSANAELRGVLQAHADATLPTMREQVRERVRERLIATLPQGEPAIAAVAAQLGMSARSLQRHLSAEGTSFRAVLDDTRAALARGYLRRSDLDIGDIAFLLGFAQVQSFYRAFRRWTGQTPETSRRHA